MNVSLIGEQRKRYARGDVQSAAAKDNNYSDHRCSRECQRKGSLAHLVDY